MIISPETKSLVNWELKDWGNDDRNCGIKYVGVIPWNNRKIEKKVKDQVKKANREACSTQYGGTEI